MDLSKRNDENENQYIWRIGKKIDSGEIPGWKDIVDILNKELRTDETEYRDESAYRKKYQYAKMFYNDVFSKYDSDEYLQELKERQLNIEKERQKLNATKVEFNRGIRQQSRFELFYDNIRSQIPIVKPPEFQWHENVIIPKKDYILTIADIHCGAEFDSENNSYSLNECASRFDDLLNETVKFILEKDLGHINVLELGDSIQGLLRMNDLKINETSVVEATIFVAKLLTNFLNMLSTYCYIDYYHCPTANHSQMRLLNAKASELAAEDIEYIIGNYIKDALQDNKRVTVHTNFGNEYIEMDILNYNIIAMHGHQIKNIDDSLKNLSQLRRKFYDIVFLAHYHGGYEKIVNENINCDAEVIVCPSFVGSDPYSDGLLKGSKAACKIYGIDEYRGHIETYKIILN